MSSFETAVEHATYQRRLVAPDLHIRTASPFFEDDGYIAALAASDTVAVTLPCTPFGLAEAQYTPARQILEAGGLLAIATDLNPGTAWCESMQFAIALACRYLRLTPAQAIAAATINAACAVSRANRVGSLEPGKQADLLILSVSDYRHLGIASGNLVQTVIKKSAFILYNQPA
jgi:imidazolonepropionase